jgi:hypothetical protein
MNPDDETWPHTSTKAQQVHPRDVRRRTRVMAALGANRSRIARLCIAVSQDCRTIAASLSY